MVIIACETLKSELLLAMEQTGCYYPVIWVESGLHERPQSLRGHLQEVIDGIDCDTALLAFGFCGNSTVGLTSRRTQLILPRVADCIPLFLGSREKREQMGADTYFFTGGYLQGERNIVSEYERSLQKYGVETADWLLRELLKHYKRLAIVDTGAFEVAPVIKRISRVAELLGIPIETINGDLGYFRELLTGPWTNERFLIVPPDGSVALEDSLNTGLSQI